MKVSRSVLTPLPLASTAKALHHHPLLGFTTASSHNSLCNASTQLGNGETTDAADLNAPSHAYSVPLKGNVLLLCTQRAC